MDCNISYITKNINMYEMEIVEKIMKVKNLQLDMLTITIFRKTNKVLLK